jgi:Coenzyme PQQ synthesis protein D (PqqD)
MGDDRMTKKRYVARSSEIAARKLGSEMLIMSGRDSTLYTLNDVATVIWEAADGSTSLDEIVESRICSQFDVQPCVAFEDAETLVEELASHGILLVSNEPIAPTVPPRPEAR